VAWWVLPKSANATANALEQALESGYERVYTAVDYCDGPRKGIAEYRDYPHLYVRSGVMRQTLRRDYYREY